MSEYVTFCNGKWRLRVGRAGGTASGRITGAYSKKINSSCPGIEVPASKATVRSVVDTNVSSVFSIMSDPSAGVSDTLAEYPDAGSGPYTFQLKDDKLKMQLDASVEGVSDNSINVDATVDGKISIPYDIGGSTYDSERNSNYEQINSTIYISAMSNGKYAKLGTANKNGKGSVVLDVNNLVTKTSGKIDTQTITFDIYQEEITNDGYTNFISQPTTITMNIKGLKDAQAPLTITNEDTLP